MTEPQDGWLAGTAYENFMGRWSRQLAPRFVSWHRSPAGRHWLDVGCGTGALATAIHVHADPASVLGCDPAAAFVEFAQREVRGDRLSFRVAGVGALPRREGGYDCVTSLLALNFFPDPKAAVQEMKGLTAPGGTVSACVWDYGGKMEFLRYFWDAVVAADPQARDQDEGERFPICDRDALLGLFRDAGLADVVCEGIDIPTRFADFSDYWRPFLGKTGPAAAYASGLDEGRRERLARRLEQSLPRQADGAIGLVARAWAVKGAVEGVGGS